MQETDPRCIRVLLNEKEQKTLRKALFIYQGQLYKKFGGVTKEQRKEIESIYDKLNLSLLYQIHSFLLRF